MFTNDLRRHLLLFHQRHITPEYIRRISPSIVHLLHKRRSI